MPAMQIPSVFIPFHFCSGKLHYLSLIDTLPVTIFMSSELYCPKGITAPSTLDTYWQSPMAVRPL